MRIEINNQTTEEITEGCIIVTSDTKLFLITKNELDAPCRCSESMTEGYVAVSLDTMSTWSVFNKIEDIRECFTIVRVIQPENILLKEI